MRKLFLLFILIPAIARSQGLKPFKKGDRIAFVGNSITDGGHYHSYIWLYYMTRFPAQRIDIYNAGIGGDIASQIYNRLESGVFAWRPNIVTLTFGMNDTGYQEFLRTDAKELTEAKLAISLASFAMIEDRLKKETGVRKIMIASSPYDETSKIKTTAFTGKNTMLLKIADVQQASAKKNNWEFIDFNRPMVAINEREEKNDSAFTICGNDRIHPSNDGHMVMAWLFLKQQGFEKKKVAGIALNASSSKVVSTDNCTITNAKFAGNLVSFDYLAKALPYPFDTVARGGSGGMNARRQIDALKIIPFTQDFNQEMLTVSGLKDDVQYQLMIDSIQVGNWKGREFEAGINLALLTNTPQYQQALAIMTLNEERWELERRLREYYWLHYSILMKKGLLFNDAESTYDSVKLYAKRDVFVRGVVNTYQKARFPSVRETWRKEIDLLVNEIYTLNRPVTRRISIKKL